MAKDFSQAMDNAYIIPNSIGIGSGEPTDIRCQCDTVADFKTFATNTGFDIRYEGLVTYEKTNKRLMAYEGNETWKHVGGGSDVDLSDYVSVEALNQRLDNLSFNKLTKAEYDAIQNKDENTVYIISDIEEVSREEFDLVKNKVDEHISNHPSGGGGSIIVEDVLTSTSATNALSARQGKVLDDKITVLKSDLSSRYTNSEIDKKVEDVVVTNIDGQLVLRDIFPGEIFEIGEGEVIPPPVNKPVTGVTLNKPVATVPKGSTETLIAAVIPADATNKSVVWSSSNNSIATVSNGVVSGIANGNATITVTTVDGNFKATCNVTVETVTISVESVSIKSTHTFKVDETVQLTPTIVPSNASNKNVSWTSNDETKATVVDGLVTAKAEGDCIITVITEDGNKTSTCNLTINAKDEVIPPPSDELVTGVEDGLIGLWDFTKENGTDLVGNNDFDMSSQQFKYGGYMPKDLAPSHLQKSILPNTYTAFATAINRSKERPDNGGSNSIYYWGGKSIMVRSSNIEMSGIGTNNKTFDFSASDNVCNVIALSFDNSSKAYKLYKDGIVILSGTDTGTYTDDLFRILRQDARNIVYNSALYDRVLLDSEVSTVSENIKRLNKTLAGLNFEENGLTSAIKFNRLTYNSDMYSNGNNLLNFVTSESNVIVNEEGYKQINSFSTSTHSLPIDSKNWTIGIRVNIKETSNKQVLNTPNIALHISTLGVGYKVNNGALSSLYPANEVSNIILTSSATDGVKMYVDGVLKHTNSTIINALQVGILYISSSLNIYDSLVVYNRNLSDIEVSDLNSKMEVF